MGFFSFFPSAEASRFFFFWAHEFFFHAFTGGRRVVIREAKKYSADKKRKCARMATQFVQHTVRTGLKGAAIGAVAGMGLSVAYSVVSGPKKDNRDKEDATAPPVPENLYHDLEQESDIFYLVQDMGEMRVSAPNIFDHMCDALNRLCALNRLVHSVQKEEFQPGWAVTSHHHAENARDAMREITEILSNRPATQAEFAERVDEINAWITNTLHNISMQVQTRIMDSV